MPCTRKKAGYDGVYAAGFEEGGHPLSDDVTTMVLTPRIADSVKIPVVTVGGIADGRSMAAALTLGACRRHDGEQVHRHHDCAAREHQAGAVKRQENETTLFCKTIGLQGRALRNKIISEVLRAEGEGKGIEALIPLIAGQRIKRAWETGMSRTPP